MINLREITACILLLAFALVPASAVEISDGGVGQVLIVRHALAPGTGDPANFTLDDCSTQRNLNDQGRKQSQIMGAWLRAQGVSKAKVYTSQWCRCRETAELLGYGTVTDLPALNSFYQRWEDRAPNMAALRRFLKDHPRNAELSILVTHQVTITALTDIFPASGTGVLLELEADGEWSQAGSVLFSE